MKVLVTDIGYVWFSDISASISTCQIISLLADVEAKVFTHALFGED